MERWNVILGVDVSKLTLDISCAERRLHIKIDNKTQGFNTFKKWCKTHDIDLKKTLVIMEYTGGYEYRFLQFCESSSIYYLRVPGLEIKNSMGIARGKNDKDDSFRIGKYGEYRRSELEPSKPLDNTIIELKQLLSFRKRLVRDIAAFEVTIKERKHMYLLKKSDTIAGVSKKVVTADKKYLLQIEKEIMGLIRADEDMLLNYRILTSIKGIGPVNAWMTLAYTENFNSFTNARKYAVYAGVVPFNNKSGTSLKGRDRVSHMANKELKQELNQAAKTAITHDPELSAYAERKLKNKPYPLVLNNVKFKLILRMFSLVKRGEKYVENYKRFA
jgi:transposase